MGNIILKLYTCIEYVAHSYTQKKYLIMNKTNTVDDLTKYNDKKIITVSPSGLYGFYTLGICAYIYEHYDLSDYIFSGTSAGSWNCLFMSMKDKKKLSILKTIINNDLYKNKNSEQVLHELKRNILTHCVESDFDLSRVFIGLATIGKTHIHTEFKDLEDVLDCCICSSNIPFLTGSIFQLYNNVTSYDGIFSKNPYINDTSILHVHHNMWDQHKEINFNLIQQFNLEELYEKGYQDTEKYGKETLDKLFK